MKPMVSVITVAFNAAQVIDKTIRSVLAQNYSNYEYIFIDGASKDETVRVIESYRDRFESLGVRYTVISEPDRGVYDAMNKGIALAFGEWIIMMNAGDCFADESVLKDFFCDRSYTASVVYGDTILKDGYKNKAFYKFMPAAPLEQIEEHIPFCHQSVFVKRVLMQKNKFNLEYRIVADYDFFLKAYLEGEEFHHINRVVSLYDCTGLSASRPHKTLEEQFTVRKKAGLVDVQKPWTMVILQTKDLIRKTVKRMIPGIFYAKARGWQCDYPCDGF